MNLRGLKNPEENLTGGGKMEPRSLAGSWPPACSCIPVKWGKEGGIYANERGWEFSLKSAEARVPGLRKCFWGKPIKGALTKVETEESHDGVQIQSHTSASSHRRDSRR